MCSTNVCEVALVTIPFTPLSTVVTAHARHKIASSPPVLASRVYLGHFLARFFRRNQALLAEGVETWQSLERREEVRATMQVSSSRIFSKAVTSATTEGAWAITDACVL